MCLAAMAKTRSVKSAARYLNCSYHHLKRYMKLYQDEETGIEVLVTKPGAVTLQCNGKDMALQEPKKTKSAD